jgi:hypothetical protein
VPFNDTRFVTLAGIRRVLLANEWYLVIQGTFALIQVSTQTSEGHHVPIWGHAFTFDSLSKEKKVRVQGGFDQIQAFEFWKDEDSHVQ